MRKQILVAKDVSAEQTSVLAQAVSFLSQASLARPSSAATVTALLQVEKAAKQNRAQSVYSQLLGDWRLGFITGTTRSRQRAGIVLGAGRFLPTWIKIQLSFSVQQLTNERGVSCEEDYSRGTACNSVTLGPLHLALSGPVKFLEKRNILAFDFTRMTIRFWGRKTYDGYIRGGQERELGFYQQTLKEQAFFHYFLIEENYLAARGRGGGLALWTKA